MPLHCSSKWRYHGVRRHEASPWRNAHRLFAFSPQWWPYHSADTRPFHLAYFHPNTTRSTQPKPFKSKRRLCISNVSWADWLTPPRNIPNLEIDSNFHLPPCWSGEQGNAIIKCKLDFSTFRLLLLYWRVKLKENNHNLKFGKNFIVLEFSCFYNMQMHFITSPPPSKYQVFRFLCTLL